MNTRRLIVAGLIFILVLGFDIMILPNVSWLHSSINLTLLAVIALTVGERSWVGFGAAVLAGLAWQLFSATSGPGYIIAYVAAVGACWLFSHRIVTTRSAISFISTVSVGTLSYTVALIAVESILSAFDRQRLHLDLIVVAETGILQAITHPIILSLFWRLFGRHEYHRLTTSPTQSF